VCCFFVGEVFVFWDLVLVLEGVVVGGEDEDCVVEFVGLV